MGDDAGGEALEVAPGVRVSVDEVAVRYETSGGPGGQHANRSRYLVVERRNADLGGGQQASDPHLTRSVAPCLSNDGRDHVDGQA